MLFSHTFVLQRVFLFGINLLLKHVHFCVDGCLYLSSIQYEEKILDSGCTG